VDDVLEAQQAASLATEGYAKRTTEEWINTSLANARVSGLRIAQLASPPDSPAFPQLIVFLALGLVGMRVAMHRYCQRTKWPLFGWLSVPFGAKFEQTDGCTKNRRAANRSNVASALVRYQTRDASNHHERIGMSFNLSSTPFSSASAWNLQVPTGATYTAVNWPTSTGWNYGTGWGAVPVYVASSSDPVVQVSVPASWGWPGGTVSVHVPTGATGGGGTDAPVVIVDGDIAYNFWRFNRTSNTTATAQSYGEANVATGTGWGTSSQGAGITAAGASELGGLLVQAQTNTGTIDHALQLAVDSSLLKPGYIAPAISTDGSNSNGTLQEGQLLAIAPGTPMPSGLSPLGQEVFRALQQYGAYVIDSGGTQTAIRTQANAYDATTMNALRLDVNSFLPLLQAVSGGTPTSSSSTSASGGTSSSGTSSSGTTSGGTTVTTPTGGTSSGSTTASSGSGSSTPTTPVAPTLTVADHSLSVSPGGQVALGVSVSVPHAGDNVSVNISGLPGYETITDKLDGKTFSGSSVTLTAAEVNSGLTLSSSFKGHGRPSATLTLTAHDATGTPTTSAAQTITVKDPPAVTTSSGPSTTTGGSTWSGDSLHHTSDHHNAVATTSSGTSTTTSGNSSSHSQASHSNIAQWFHDYPGFAHVATTLSEAGASRSGIASTPTTTTTTDPAAGAGAKAYALLNQMMAGDFGHDSHFAQTAVTTALSALSQHQPNVLTRALH